MESLFYLLIILFVWSRINRIRTTLRDRHQRLEDKLDLIIEHFDLSPPYLENSCEFVSIVRYKPVLTLSAETDLIQLHTLQQLPKPQILLESIRANLLRDVEFRSDRRKSLMLGNLTCWSLRVDQYRLFYILPKKAQVKIIAIGHRVNNDLFIRDENKATDIFSFEKEHVDLGENEMFMDFLDARAREGSYRSLEDIEQNLTQIQLS